MVFSGESVRVTMSLEPGEMSEKLKEYRNSEYWVHITLPVNLESIRQDGLEPGHTITDKRLFEEYYEDHDPSEVVEAREYAEELLDKVRTEVYPGETAPSRSDCVALWADATLAFDMRSAVLGDAHSFGVVVVDPEQVETDRFLLGEYQLVAQVTVNAKAREAQQEQGASGEEVTEEDIVHSALQYWSAATITNTPDAIEQQSPMFQLPEVLVKGGVSQEAIVDVFEHPAVEFDENSEGIPEL